MEKKELLMNATFVNNAETLRSVRQNTKNIGFIGLFENLTCVKQLAHIYSVLLEEPVSNRRTLKFLHAQVAAFFLILPADMPFGLRALFLLWTGLACWQCRTGK